MIRSIFPNPSFIYIVRRNKVRQAISLTRAEMSGRWWWNANEQKPVGFQSFYRIPYGLIKANIRNFNESENGWEKFFRSCDISPHKVVYEELVRYPDKVVAGCLRFLGETVNQDFKAPEPLLQKQADLQTELWVCYYYLVRLFCFFVPVR